MPLIYFSIYRYDPEKPEQKPYFKNYEVDTQHEHVVMLLDALLAIRKQDPSLALRKSCREGVCGSDGMNINGKNGLAFITPLALLEQAGFGSKSHPIVIKPFPGMPVIKDLIVDMEQFYKNYKKAKPSLQNDNPPVAKEHLQTPQERAKLDGLYECILCGCCSSACPSYWWNPDKFMGPAALLQACRFILDNRDTMKEERLNDLNDAHKVFRCRSIMNCVDVCPKGLNPTQAIAQIRDEMLSEK